jgi:DNA topoisomerase-1
MALAQGLYEGREVGDRGAIGLITYMRTDSTRVADEALTGGREFIAKTYGADALPEKPNFYASKKGAQDAHEAIRPTSFDLPPDVARNYLGDDEWKLYKLIWDRFVASQMLPALFDVTQVDVEHGRYVLRASSEEEEAMLPPVTEGQTLKLVKVNSEQKFTQPPAQYSEATLVKALEENGIGRPSTYASILSTLTERDYVGKSEGRFRPSPLGKLVNSLLQQGFNDILNEGYTAALEEQLDEIEEGRVGWKRAIAEFDEKFTRDLSTAGDELPNVKREGLPMDESCPECGSPLRVRFGRYGAFVACSNYPECKYTRNLEEETKDAAQPGSEEEIPPCEVCGKPMALKRSRYGTFFGCTGYPECKNIRKTGPQAAPPKPTGVPCPECGKGEIVEKRSFRGKTFWSCNRYPDCKFSLWKKPVLRDCPVCGASYLLEKVTKKAGTQYVCATEGCKHVEDAMEVEAVAT